MRRRRIVTHREATGNKSPPEEDATAISIKNLFYSLLIFRLGNALLVQTFFNPDEYWQSLEVAHKMAFGYGHLTWEWREGIRSYLHPLVFAVLYKILQMFGLDHPIIIRLTPKLLQAVFAALTDLHTFIFAKRFFSSERVAFWALFCQLANWFTFYCSTRTYSNCLEACFVQVALCYWPMSTLTPVQRPEEVMTRGIHVSKSHVAVVLAALSVALRPTSLIIWAFLGALELAQATTTRKMSPLLRALPVGAAVLGLCVAIDSVLYGRFVVVPYRFLMFNVVQGGSVQYGVHSWHWYFSQGLPASVALFLPLSLHGLFLALSTTSTGPVVPVLVFWTVGCYSALSHKEFRFLLPIFPLFFTYSGLSLSTLSLQSQLESSARPEKSSSIFPKWKTWGLGFKASLAVIMAMNSLAALYFSLVHQRGAISVMAHLQREVVQWESTVPKVNSPHFAFLMPCHSTPLYSYLHKKVNCTFLDCSPTVYLHL